MPTRFAFAILTGVGLISTMGQQATVTIGSARISVPSHWRELTRQEDRITFSSTNGHQQAIISLIRLSQDASFEDFRKLCESRLTAEKLELSDGFVQEHDPSNDNGKFALSFSGEDNKTGRLFSGYLTLRNQEFLALYVEGTTATRKEHSKVFWQFARCFNPGLEDLKVPLWQACTQTGRTNIWRLSENQLETLPRWRPGQGEPPVGLGTAITAAKAWAISCGVSTNLYVEEILVKSLNPCCPENDELYSIQFYRIVFGGIGLYGHRMSAIVLMDGAVVQPEQPGYSGPMRSFDYDEVPCPTSRGNE